MLDELELNLATVEEQADTEQKLYNAFYEVNDASYYPREGWDD